jgi:integrase
MTVNTQDTLPGPLHEEIEGFIAFKQKSGSAYISSAYALRAFDRFCSTPENKGMTLQQLVEAWAVPSNGKPSYDGGCSVRQLGQYLTEIGHPKAFTALSDKGNGPRLIGIGRGPFAEEIKEFASYKRTEGRKYTTAEYCLEAFDKFCSMHENGLLTCQQLADAWCRRFSEKNGYYISVIREFGLYLTIQRSNKSFELPYADGSMPRPAFTGYSSLYAEEIEAFLEARRSAGAKYRHEDIRLKDFDRFCSEHPGLSLQQLADTYICTQKDCSRDKAKRSTSVMRSFGAYLTDNAHPDAFTITHKGFVAGPYAEEAATFVAFKRSCGYKYKSSGYQLGCFDRFCALEENEGFTPQQLADRWVLKRGDEHPNSRAGRVGPVRVFGKYLTSLGHAMAFSIADDVARGGMAKPPHLFSEQDIEAFFGACARLGQDDKDPTAHIVLPTAFLFMHCLGVRTCELKVLVEDVDCDTGEVVIVDAKNGDRVVYMSEELSVLLSRYDAAIEKFFPDRKYLFPASKDRPRSDFSKHFREIWDSNISSPADDKPRLYDFRHHLLYRNVELHMRGGKDVNVLRPYIMRHMGHRLPESFQYYFHLSPPIREEVSRIKQELDWMLPDIPEVPYE